MITFILAGLGIGASLISAQATCIYDCLISSAVTATCGTTYPSNLECICNTASVLNSVMSCLSQNCPASELDIDKAAMQDICSSYGGGGGGGGVTTTGLGGGGGGGDPTDSSPTGTSTGGGGGGGGGGLPTGTSAGGGGGGGGTSPTFSVPANQPTNPLHKPGAADRRAELLGNTGRYGFTALFGLAGIVAGAIAIGL